MVLVEISTVSSPKVRVEEAVVREGEGFYGSANLTK